MISKCSGTTKYYSSIRNRYIHRFGFRIEVRVALGQEFPFISELSSIDAFDLIELDCVTSKVLQLGCPVRNVPNAEHHEPLVSYSMAQQVQSNNLLVFTHVWNVVLCADYDHTK
eukprot:266234-Amphidinium_carterae.1